MSSLNRKRQKMEKKKSWLSKVETDMVEFMNEHGLQKMVIEDEICNKAKLTKCQDGCIKIEYTQVTIL